MLFMTVPTAGTRRNLLTALVRDCGLPQENVVIVSTRPEAKTPKGVRVVEDFGPPNIQRWWNQGLDESQKLGATVVAVVNDDIALTPRTLPKLYQELICTEAAIASPMREEFGVGLHTRPLIPYAPRLWGSLWMLRLDSGLRPDESYVWWYGDNDLDIRARKSFGGVLSVDVEYRHLHPGEGTAVNPHLQVQSDRDGELFESQYARLLRMSRFVKGIKARAWRLNRGSDAAE